MERTFSRGLRYLGAGVLLSELAIMQIGFGFTSNLTAWAATAALNIVGSLLLLVYRVVRGLSFRKLDGAMWVAIGRVAGSNTLIGAAYIIAVQEVGLGVVAAISAVGPLAVNLIDMLLSLRKRNPVPVRAWARKHLMIRLLALAGVLAVTDPFDGTVNAKGLAWAVVCAACFWNYVKMTFGRMREKGRVGEGLALANLFCMPLTAVLVIPFGGWESMSWHVLLFGGLVAGALVLAIPAILQEQATRMGVTEDLGSVLYCFDTPIAVLVGLTGAGLGWLADVQRPTGWVLAGMLLVLIASLGSVRLGDKPKGATGRSGRR